MCIMILAKCPLRISLVGGSTDMISFIDKFHRGAVISFTPNLCTYVSIHQNNIDKYIINCTQREITHSIDKIKNDIVRECLRYFETPPCTITFNTNILSTGSGLASSSSYFISMIKAISMFQGISMSNKAIYDIAYKLEKNVNPLAGYQDVYGCGVGNFKRIDFKSGGQESYKFLDFSFILEKYNMYILNTGIIRKSTNILKTIDVDKSYYLLSMVDNLEKSIIDQDEEKFFKVLNRGWEIKKSTSSEVMANAELIAMEKHLINFNGVAGIKLCGAGGGGYFLIFLNKEKDQKFKKYFAKKYPSNSVIQVNVESNGVVGVKI